MNRPKSVDDHFPIVIKYILGFHIFVKDPLWHVGSPCPEKNGVHVIRAITVFLVLLILCLDFF